MQVTRVPSLLKMSYKIFLNWSEYLLVDEYCSKGGREHYDTVENTPWTWGECWDCCVKTDKVTYEGDRARPHLELCHEWLQHDSEGVAHTLIPLYIIHYTSPDQVLPILPSITRLQRKLAATTNHPYLLSPSSSSGPSSESSTRSSGSSSPREEIIGVFSWQSKATISVSVWNWSESLLAEVPCESEGAAGTMKIKIEFDPGCWYYLYRPGDGRGRHLSHSNSLPVDSNYKLYYQWLISYFFMVTLWT